MTIHLTGPRKLKDHKSADEDAQPHTWTVQITFRQLENLIFI